MQKPPATPFQPHFAPVEPTLTDQHWRLELRAKSQTELNRDMHDAIKTQNFWRMNVLVTLPLDWEYLSDWMLTAVATGNPDTVAALIHFQPSWKDRLGPDGLYTMAELAVQRGHLEILDFMIGQGVPATGGDESLLADAARYGHPAVTSYLLEAGANPAADGAAPLKIACESGDVDIVRMMIETGKVAPDINDNMPLYTALDYDSDDIVAYLLSKGAVPDDDLRAQILEKAAENGATAVIGEIIRQGSITYDEKSDTLVKSAEAGNMAAVELLVVAGADINAGGGQVLRAAIEKSDGKMASFLLSHGADPNAAHYDDTPLIAAVIRGSVTMAKLLLDHGADPLQFQKSALAKAIELKNRKMSKFMEDACVSRMAAIEKSKKAEFISAFGENYTLNDLREKTGPSGETGLLIAARSGVFADIVGVAVQKGQEPLLPSDFYHPAFGADTVLSVLVENNSLQQAFTPELWGGHPDAMQAVLASFPDKIAGKLDLDAVKADMNRRAIAKKTEGRQFHPPKFGG